MAETELQEWIDAEIANIMRFNECLKGPRTAFEKLPYASAMTMTAYSLMRFANQMTEALTPEADAYRDKICSASVQFNGV